MACDVVIAAHLQAQHPVDLFIAAGQEHDGQPTVVDPTADLETIHFGHHHVEYDQVRCPTVDFCEGLSPIPSGSDRKSGPLERVRDHFAKVGVIVDHQNFSHGSSDAERHRTPSMAQSGAATRHRPEEPTGHDAKSTVPSYCGPGTTMLRTTLFILLAVLLGACRTIQKDGTEVVVDTGALAVDRDGDGVIGDDDCDELDASVHAGADEVCDGIDNDCDGDIDEGVLQEWYADEDADGFGNPDIIIEACEPFAGVSSNGTDCDDTDEDVYPGAPEECNGIDDNCDGTIDELGRDTWYLDADGDGHGDPEAPVEDCDPGAGYVLVATTVTTPTRQ